MSRFFIPVPVSQASGVGNINADDESSRALMPRADTTSWYKKRPCAVSLSFQVRHRLVEPHTCEASNIFANNPPRPQAADNPKHLRPQVALVTKASPLSGCRKRLTGKSARNEGDAFMPRSFKKHLLCNLCNVSKAHDIRPMLFKYGQWKIRFFALTDSFKACDLCGYVYAADTAK
jgi:hypothetical protein